MGTMGVGYVEEERPPYLDRDRRIVMMVPGPGGLTSHEARVGVAGGLKAIEGGAVRRGEAGQFHVHVGGVRAGLGPDDEVKVVVVFAAGGVEKRLRMDVPVF